MQDYRNNPEDSPFAWSPYQNRLVEVTPHVTVMRTVFYVSPTGIYPYVKAEEIETRAVS